MNIVVDEAFDTYHKVCILLLSFFHILVSSYRFIYFCRVSTLNHCTLQRKRKRKRKWLSKCIMNCLWLAMEISMEKKFLNLETPESTNWGYNGYGYIHINGYCDEVTGFIAISICMNKLNYLIAISISCQVRMRYRSESELLDDTNNASISKNMTISNHKNLSTNYK